MHHLHTYIEHFHTGIRSAKEVALIIIVLMLPDEVKNSLSTIIKDKSFYRVVSRDGSSEYWEAQRIRDLEVMSVLEKYI